MSPLLPPSFPPLLFSHHLLLSRYATYRTMPLSWSWTYSTTLRSQRWTDQCHAPSNWRIKMESYTTATLSLWRKDHHYTLWCACLLPRLEFSCVYAYFVHMWRVWECKKGNLWWLAHPYTHLFFLAALDCGCHIFPTYKALSMQRSESIWKHWNC